MSCEVPSATIYKTVCENWKSAKYCLDHPEKFEFTALVPVDTILLMDENMFFRGKHYIIPKCIIMNYLD